jgi:hypothetical protein
LNSRIFLYAAGHLGEPAYLVGYREVILSHDHRLPLEQHFGLDSAMTYDVQVTYPRLTSSPGRLVGEKLNVTTAQILDFYADSGTVGVENRSSLAAGMEMNVSPNPFKTAVSFELSAARKEKIKDMYIYTVSGKCVARLTAHCSPLTTSYTWNASAMPAGVYVARLQVGGATVLTRQLLLMK